MLGSVVWRQRSDVGVSGRGVVGWEVGRVKQPGRKGVRWWQRVRPTATIGVAPTWCRWDTCRGRPRGEGGWWHRRSVRGIPML